MQIQMRPVKRVRVIITKIHHRPRFPPRPRARDPGSRKIPRIESHFRQFPDGNTFYMPLIQQFKDIVIPRQKTVHFFYFLSFPLASGIMICTSATRIAEFFIASSPQRLPAPQTFHFLTASNMPQVRHPERHCQGYSLIFADSGILSGNKYLILKLCPFFHPDNRPPDYRFHLRKFQSVIGNVSTRFQTFLNISKYLVIYILSECGVTLSSEIKNKTTWKNL